MSEVVPIGCGPMSPRQIVRTWVMRFNAADADRFAELYHEHAVASLPESGRVVGKLRIRSLLRKRFRRGTSPRFAETIYGRDRTAVLDWRDLDGDCGSVFFTVDDGRILRHNGAA